MTNNYYLDSVEPYEASILVDEQTLPHVETQVQRRFAGLLRGLLRPVAVHRADKPVGFIPLNFRGIF